MLFKPTFALNTFSDITPQLLKEYKITAIFLDVDNTLSPPSSQIVYDGVEKWLKEIHSLGISIVICSNNYKRRVEPFAKGLGLDCVAMSLKPLPHGFNKAKKKLLKNSDNILVVGDQIFTDILGANLGGMKSALLVPQSPEKGISIRIRRRLERPIRRKLYNKPQKG